MAICADCGGSGIQRIGDQRFKTCLSCLGQGNIVSTETGVTGLLGFSAQKASVSKAETAVISAEHFPSLLPDEECRGAHHHSERNSSEQKKSDRSPVGVHHSPGIATIILGSGSCCTTPESSPHFETLS
ncbi:hypothetical protein OMCYN_00009 [cyanobiont of Ornithocercus magnificus]|nr:hypothetical protein OMCYN_00009 [cyanobiont of Ornithocercus magnificus]